MVQIVNMGKSASGMLAESLGQAAGEFGGTVGGEKLGFERKKGRIQEAFDKADPNTPFIEQLRAIAPTLLATEGGAQALGEIAPLLGKQAESQAYRNYLAAKKAGSITAGGQGPGQSQPSPNQPQVQPPQQTQQRPPKPPGMSDADYNYRYPVNPKSPFTTFPERTAGPTTVPELSPGEFRDEVDRVLEESQLSGNPINIAQATQAVDTQEQQKRNYNQKIDQEKERTELAQKKITQDVVDRAVREGLVSKDQPEDVAVVEQLALQAKDAPSEVDRWNYVKQGQADYKRSRENIQREIGRADPLTQLYRFATGTYKEKEETIKDIQKDIDVYKKYNLIPELRNDLRDNLGFGAEDIETAIYPFQGQEKEQLNSFRKNSSYPKEAFNTSGIRSFDDMFPSTKYEMKGDQYAQFKDDLANYLNQNPKVNLVALRGNLNQDKKYAWQDISRAMTELIQEKKFDPDRLQNFQLDLINKPPIPGLAAQFGFIISGAK